MGYNYSRHLSFHEQLFIFGKFDGCFKLLAETYSYPNKYLSNKDKGRWFEFLIKKE